MNPKLKDFLDNNKDITLLGFWWSFTWRSSLVITLAYIVLMVPLFLIAILGAL